MCPNSNLEGKIYAEQLHLCPAVNLGPAVYTDKQITPEGGGF